MLTTTWAGAAHQGIDLLREPGQFATGLPYSFALLAILGVHELGHYFAARRHGINVTPPFFIPVPFALGTFGAFIQMRSPTENGRSLFDVAIAGPLAGLAVAIPALLIGLRSSTILPVDAAPAGHMFGGTSAGSSLLFALLARLLALFVWSGLMMWAIIVFFIAGRSTPPLNDVTPITPGRRWLGYATFAILASILVPLPHALWTAAGFHCPYL